MKIILEQQADECNLWHHLHLASDGCVFHAKIALFGGKGSSQQCGI